MDIKLNANGETHLMSRQPAILPLLLTHPPPAFTPDTESFKQDAPGIWQLDTPSNRPQRWRDLLPWLGS